MDYWREELAGVQQLQLPTDVVRAGKACSRGGWLAVSVEERVVVALESFAARCGATMFMVLLSALQLLLAARSGQDDVVVSHAASLMSLAFPAQRLREGPTSSLYTVLSLLCRSGNLCASGCPTWQAPS